MVAQVPDRRTGWLAGAVGIALLLAGLTLLLEPASRRAGAAALLAKAWLPAWSSPCAYPPRAASGPPWNASTTAPSWS